MKTQRKNYLTFFTEDPDPHLDPYENVMDPEHCKKGRKVKEMAEHNGANWELV